MRLLRALTVPILLILASTGCQSGGGGNSGGASPGATGKDKIVVGFVQAPTSLDITSDATASIATMLRDNLYEGLLRTDAAGVLIPQLATGWDTSPDGKTYTFHLRSTNWQDGTPFNAQDVKFSWDRARDPQNKPANPHVDYWAPVSSVDVVDDHTVKVSLKQYSDNFLFHMAQGSAAIIPKSTHVVSPNPVATNLATQPVGTGPFKFSTYVPNASLNLVRNDAWWGSKPKLNQVTFRFITDANAMNNALKAGDIDAIAQLGGPEQLPSFKSNNNFRILEGVPAGKIMVAYNNSKGALKDVRVRKAISMAIDKKAWIDGVFSGYAVPIGSHAVPNVTEPYYVDENQVNKYDPNEAKKQLAAAGYASGLTLHLAEVSDFPYAVRGGDILNSELKAIGVTLQIDTMTFNGWLHTVFLPPQDYDLTIINHVEPRDIGNYANPKYYWHYDNAVVAQTVVQADAEQDQAKRKSMYATVQKQLADDAANGYIMSAKQIDVIRANLHGYPEKRLSTSLYLAKAYFS
ncbi:MAG: ABC transporter substrate-binding protein [Candidatus Dormibacteraeota bacterium]|nr:ABC transporter substrate-binding protein [Candidatus Dormibacteraeota bacterium]